MSTSRAFFGGGGGAGDSNNNNGTAGTAGAAGGGFLFLAAGGTISCSNNNGLLLADGGSVTANSANDAPGGGGGGGTIVVSAAGLSGVSLLARGGKGGGQGAIGVEAEGTGGGGGGGLVSYTNGTPTTDVSGGLNGTTASSSLTEFPPNGGTRGGAGRVVAGACSQAGLCPAAVADVATTISFGTNPLLVGQPAVINVVFANNGVDVASSVTRVVQLPAGLGVGAVTVSTAVGSGSYNNSTGQVTFTTIGSLASGSTANATISYLPSAGGTVAVSSTISATTWQSCQVDDDTSGATNLLIYPVDLQVTLSGPGTAAANSPVTYTATVQNLTPLNSSTVDATNTVLTVQLAKGLLSTSFPAGTTYNFDTGLATLAIGPVSRGAAALSYDFTFTLPNNNQPVAAVASVRATEPDPDATNNDGIAGTMRVATAVGLSTGTGPCAGTAYDGTTATQGIYAEYFKGYFNNVLTYFDAPNSADISRSEGNVNYPASNAWGDLSDAMGSGSVTNPDAFSARYRGYLTIAAAGTYTFALVSDEAAYLWLGNPALAAPLVAADAVVADPGPHGGRTTTGTPVALAAGTYPLLALYGEQAGANQFVLQYSGPDTGSAMVNIPAPALCNRQLSSSGPLPVTLTAFTAQTSGRAAGLSWRTASEQHNDHFDVERSRDGVAFAPIGQVPGAGTSTVALDYRFVDNDAAPAGGGTVYYRLRQVDTDGSSHYSPVRSLAWDKLAAAAAGLQLYPNPAAQRVRLGLPLPGAGTVRLTDLAGRLLLLQRLPADAGAPELDLRALPAGLYVVQVEQDGQRFTQRLLHAAE